MIKSAIFLDNDYRYELRRVFDDSKPLIAFVGLNPSTAGCKEDDHTIIKCISYCESWGYGGFIMVNLFAHVSTNPKDLFKSADPIGIDNDKFLKNAFKEVDKVICCWGDTVDMQGRNKDVLRLINNPFCLIKLKNGEPGHPARLSGNLVPIRYNDTLKDNDFFQWDGYCPESFLNNENVRLRHNTDDFYESENTGLQVAIIFSGVQAVVMNFRGKGKFSQTPKYADEVFKYEMLSKHTLDRPPFCDTDFIQDEKTLKEYLATIT